MCKCADCSFPCLYKHGSLIQQFFSVSSIGCFLLWPTRPSCFAACVSSLKFIHIFIYVINTCTFVVLNFCRKEGLQNFSHQFVVILRYFWYKKFSDYSIPLVEHCMLLSDYVWLLGTWGRRKNDTRAAGCEECWKTGDKHWQTMSTCVPAGIIRWHIVRWPWLRVLGPIA